MKKRTVIGAVVAGFLLIGAVGSGGSTQPSNTNYVKSSTTTQASTKVKEKVKPTCDGTAITSGCVQDGISYKTYVYHPPEAEKSHTVTETSYREEVSGYCTLCNDGTYSPSCATGRGACSHHGGVAEWNAPRTVQVPVNTTKTIIDAPAKEAYYEKVSE